MYPKGHNEENVDHLGIFLKHLSQNDVISTYSITLISQENKKIRINFNYHLFDGIDSYGQGQFAKKSFVTDSKNDFPKDNKLTVICEIKTREKEDHENSCKLQ